jgi:hypothetical protein
MKHLIALMSVAILQTASFAWAEENCTCRGPNREYEVGQTACLSTPKGYRLAKCGVVLNNPAWQFTDTPCVSSRRATPVQLATTNGVEN